MSVAEVYTLPPRHAHGKGLLVGRRVSHLVAWLPGRDVTKGAVMPSLLKSRRARIVAASIASGQQIHVIEGRRMMPTATEMFSRWKALAGDTSAIPWAAENLAGFFQMFRPHGEEVGAAFEGVVGAEEILPRLLEVYRATAAGCSSEGSQDAYFIVRDPPAISRARVLKLLRSHLGALAAMAEAADDRDASELLGGPFRLEAVEGERPWPPTKDDPESLVYDMTCDYVSSLTPRESHALLMREAFYSIACDYNLQDYLLWPLYRHVAGIEEPFGAYFQLWRHGVGFRFQGRVAVRAYVPQGKLQG